MLNNLIIYHLNLLVGKKNSGFRLYREGFLCQMCWQRLTWPWMYRLLSVCTLVDLCPLLSRPSGFVPGKLTSAGPGVLTLWFGQRVQGTDGRREWRGAVRVELFSHPVLPGSALWCWPSLFFQRSKLSLGSSFLVPPLLVLGMKMTSRFFPLLTPAHL